MLKDKVGMIFGVANKRSIAWAIAQAWHNQGAKLAFTYQGERLKDNVEELASTFGSDDLRSGARQLGWDDGAVCHRDR